MQITRLAIAALTILFTFQGSQAQSQAAAVTEGAPATQAAPLPQVKPSGFPRKAPSPAFAPGIIPNFDQPDLSPANSAYTMTPDDLSLDCKKLTGRIQIRIRQLRSERADGETTVIARQLHQMTTPFTAGTKRGINPQGDQARDVGMLTAYNGRLRELGCPAFDLASDLAPGNSAAPKPVRARANTGPAASAKPNSAPR